MQGWSRLARTEPVTHWAMAQPMSQYYPGHPRPMPDTVTYRFHNGWVDTGDLPCREALRNALPNREIPCPIGPFSDLVVGPEGGEIDFSQFCHRPTLIAHTFQSQIRGPANSRALFRIVTCGGVRIWLDGKPVATFEPFTRNTPASCEVELEFNGEDQVLALRLEDLHERDTTCFFSLHLVKGNGVETGLPPGLEPEEIADVAAVLAGLRTERIAHQDTDVITLVADVLPRTPLTLTIENMGPFGRGGLTADPDERSKVLARLTAQRPKAILANARDLPPGCLAIPVTTNVQGARLFRLLGTTLLRKGQPLTGSLAARKSTARDLIKNSDGFEASVALCLAASGQSDPRMRRMIETALTTIEDRFDCSDFTILPLLRLWRDYAQVLPKDLRQRMRAAFLNYRYWLDEPGNDVMWFWSENHVLCFHAAQAVAGDLFPDEVFPTSNRCGADQKSLALARLTQWFDAIDEDGLCEWNSAAYYPIDLLGLLTIYDMVPALRERARKVIDQIFVMAALHTTGGVPAGTQGRCYEKELLAGPHTELGSVMTIALGGEFIAGYDRAAALLCLSEYSPPAGLCQLAEPPKGDALEAAYTQGADHAGRLTLWKSAEAQLSTVRDLNPGGQGHQAQVIDVQLARHPLARLWINHPGEARPWGERRPSLLAGSHVMPAVAQAGPTALMVFDLDRDWTDLPYSQVFAPPDGLGEPEIYGPWMLFAKSVAVWCSHPLEMETQGLYRAALWRAHAPQTGWCVALRRPNETKSAFEARLGRLSPQFDVPTLCLNVNSDGDDAPALTLWSDGRFARDGHDSPFTPLSPTPHFGWNGDPLTPWENSVDQ